MAQTKKWFTKRALLVVSLPLVLLAAVVLAGSNSTSLPNGAELTVSIDDPVTSTEFKVPVGEATIDVAVSGSASVGEGDPDSTFVYVIDVSGSTTEDSGSACGTFLQCQKDFFKALNVQIIASREADLAGLAVYAGTDDGVLATSGATADMSSAGGDQKLVAPNDDGFVATVINSTFSNAAPGVGGVDLFQTRTAGFRTNFAAGMQRACEILSDGSNDNSIGVVVFGSDGESNEGGAEYQSQLDCLKGLGARIESIAIGASSSCNGGTAGTLEEMALQTDGTCHPIDDPDDLPGIIPSLIGSTLESLEIEVDGGGKQPIPNGDISLPLPQAGAIGVDYTTTVTGLGPGDHEICVTANGSDVTGGVASVTRCETIHLLQLVATPPNEINDLNFDNQHTVTAEVVGGSGPDRNIDFVVGGQNATTATPPNASIPTAVNVPVDFVYTVPQDCASLGLDTITVSTEIAGSPCEIELTKEWIDTVPPEVSCDPTGNPHGNKPKAPGKGGPGQNPDGFYQLNAEDPHLANCTVTLLVVDGEGFVFPGPFFPGDNIKYTQDDGVPQEQKKIGSGGGQAGTVAWHLKGHGDLTVTGTDPSGNSSSATCMVPQPPK